MDYKKRGLATEIMVFQQECMKGLVKAAEPVSLLEDAEVSTAYKNAKEALKLLRRKVGKILLENTLDGENSTNTDDDEDFRASFLSPCGTCKPTRGRCSCQK